MSTIDYNVDNYTITELLAILGLDDPDSNEIIESTNSYINRFSSPGDNQPELVNFFQNIQTKLLQYMHELETSGKDAEYTPNDEQTKKWIEYQALPQENEVQRDKNTDRVQKIDVYNDQHLPMNREQLGINNNFQVKVAQDTLNPNLENTITQFINLDSQFRQASGGAESISTDYTLDLSDPLTNVLNLSLYSIQVPYTWYAIDYIYGNTCFWLTNLNNTFKIFIEPGNYSPSEFCTALKLAFTTVANFQPPNVSNEIYPTDPSSGWPNAFTYPNGDITKQDIARFNTNSGKITLYLDGWVDPAGNQIKTISQYNNIFNAESDAYFTFFDLTGGRNCYQSGTYPCSANSSQGHTFNGTLGWLMGFRLPLQPIFSANYTNSANYTGGNTPIAVMNLYGTKYFILVLDDYNQNHINNGLITITELSKTLPIPSYFNASQPYICIPNITNEPNLLNPNVIGNISNNSQQTAGAVGINPVNIFNELQDKLDFGTKNVLQVLPSAPRTLTQAQIYTVNEIIKNRNKTTSFRAKAPTNSDTFAMVPIKYGMKVGELYVEFSGALHDNKRVYFGPVNIDRMRIRLLDDRGNVIDLHGADWCVTLLAESLYQY
jgi:hypothetical protein